MKQQYDNTALMLARLNNHHEIVKLILKWKNEPFLYFMLPVLDRIGDEVKKQRPEMQGYVKVVQGPSYTWETIYEYFRHCE
jgi:hypothetical protein